MLVSESHGKVKDTTCIWLQSPFLFHFCIQNNLTLQTRKIMQWRHLQAFCSLHRAYVCLYPYHTDLSVFNIVLNH